MAFIIPVFDSDSLFLWMLPALPFALELFDFKLSKEFCCSMEVYFAKIRLLVDPLSLLWDRLALLRTNLSLAGERKLNFSLLGAAFCRASAPSWPSSKVFCVDVTFRFCFILCKNLGEVRLILFVMV